ncbi:MAG: YtfJ family protein [Candidatus Neomarinimicrobiota bacterium]
MKKGLAVLIALLICATGLMAQLTVGEKAPDWTFPDADGKAFTMDSWPGKILQINYVDPDESELNEHFNDAIKYAVDSTKIIDRETFKGFGIVDCAATWKPDILIRKIAGGKAKKFDTTILFDYDAVMREAWDLKKDSYNIVIVDQDRIVRAVIKDRVPEADVQKYIDLIIDLQKKDTN